MRWSVIQFAVVNTAWAAMRVTVSGPTRLPNESPHSDRPNSSCWSCAALVPRMFWILPIAQRPKPSHTLTHWPSRNPSASQPPALRVMRQRFTRSSPGVSAMPLTAPLHLPRKVRALIVVPSAVAPEQLSAGVTWNEPADTAPMTV